MVGTSPQYEEMNWTGLDVPKEKFDRITSIDPAAWLTELASHAEWFDKLGERLPAALLETRDKLLKRLS